MRRYVWSRNLKNEKAMARVGPQRHKEKKNLNPEATHFVAAVCTSAVRPVLLLLEGCAV